MVFFIINVNEIPNKLYVLGNEILISKNKKICQKINYYNSKDLNDKAIILMRWIRRAIDNNELYPLN